MSEFLKMVYGKEFEGSGGYVLCVLVNGMPVHERADGVVELPFETEYTIRLRNKTDKDAVAKVYVDNELITTTGLIIRKRGDWQNQDCVDLDCNIATKKKFKFVAVDSFDAIDHGKNRENDPAMGVIRVEFYPEQDRPQFQHYYTKTPIDWPKHSRKLICRYGATWTTNESVPIAATGHNFCDTHLLEAGATVDGGQSNQTFTTAYVNVDWNKPPTVLRLTLKGYWPEEQRQVSVRNCLRCNARRKRPSAKFCEMCGNRF